MSTTFHDALSGEKRKLNVKTRDKKEPAKEPDYSGTIYDPCFYNHLWDNALFDHCPCKRCGKTVLFVRVLENMKKKH